MTGNEWGGAIHYLSDLILSLVFFRFPFSFLSPT